jgi:mevalonate kinase
LQEIGVSSKELDQLVETRNDNKALSGQNSRAAEAEDA